MRIHPNGRRMSATDSHAPGGAPGTRRVLQLGGSARSWSDRVEELSAEGFDIETLSRGAEPADVALQAEREQAILIVDLDGFLMKGTKTVLTCRKLSPSTPVIVVTESPSVELAQRIRSTGVFYLALHPITTEELRTVLSDALRHLRDHKPVASTCEGRRRILVVDDDPDFRTSLQRLLEDQGYAVGSAVCGREALKKIVSEHPDLVVLDIMMEHASAGYEVTQALRFAKEYNEARSVPILMVSSIELAPSERFPHAEEMPMIQPDAYMTKPLDIPQFLAMVSSLLGAERRASAPHA